MDLRPKLSRDFSPTFRGSKGGSIEIRAEIPAQSGCKSPGNPEKSANLYLDLRPESSPQGSSAGPVYSENTDLEESDQEGQIALKMQTLNSSRTSSRGTARCPSYSPSHRSFTPKSRAFLRLAPSPSPLRLSNRTERGKCPLILDLTARETEKSGEVSVETSRLEVIKQLGATMYPRCRKVQPVKTRVSVEKEESKEEEERGYRKVCEEMEIKLRAQIAELTKSLMLSKEDKIDAEKSIIQLKSRLETDAADYQSKLKDMSTVLDQLTLKKDRFEAKTTEMEALLNKAETSTSKAIEDCRAAKEQAYIKDRENAALKAKCELLRTQIADVQSNERKLQQEVATWKEKAVALESKQTANSRNSRLEQRTRDCETEELVKEKGNLQATLGEMAAENERLRGQVASLSKKFAYLKSDELEAKENIDSYLQENTQLKAAIARFDRSPGNRPISREEMVQFASPPQSPIHFDPFSALSSSVRLKVTQRNADIVSHHRGKLATLQGERTQVGCI